MATPAAGRADNHVQWIRFAESGKRYHAVFVSAWGLLWTYCGRSIRPAALMDETGEPPAKCHCCQSRISRPYLLPEKIAKLKVVEV